MTKRIEYQKNRAVVSTHKYSGDFMELRTTVGQLVNGKWRHSHCFINIADNTIIHRKSAVYKERQSAEAKSTAVIGRFRHENDRFVKVV